MSALAAGVAAGGPAELTRPAPSTMKVEGLKATSLEHGVKSATSRLAQTDPDLLGRSDATPVNVVVKLDYDSVATYEGGLQGYEATSPRATGRKLRENRAAVSKYEGYVRGVESRIVDRIKTRVSGTSVRGSYRTVYGGIAMQLPANEIADLLAVPGVVAVQKDKLEQPLTDVTPAFVGADQVWPRLGGSSRAGEGVIVGVLDTGIWPEHPSFADPGISHPGGTYGCEFGDGSDPNLGDAFTCNDKLIGAYAKVATYMAVVGGGADEFCNDATNTCSARDPDGHGTHTTSTAAGSPVASAPLLGVDRGPISGIAPGAHVIMYRVCLAEGCFTSDSVSAVAQAIEDGVDVINFSISGGSNAYTDAVELAFLEAYKNGIAVNASAGNDGPGAGTANHAGPWTNTVGASTSDRHFISTLTLTAADGDTLTLKGATVTDGISTPTDVVRGKDVPGYADERCLTPLPAGSAAGKIVVCERAVIARVEKSYNVMQGGGAGMILYNPVLQGLATDNHFIPSVHVEGPPTQLLDFLTSNTGVKATFTPGVTTEVRGDVMAAFSSRGPLGDFIKPDVTAPGVQILAGHTPEPATVVGGKPGELFQAIQGTSMSSPHAAGVSALVKAAHPDWTPGQIKSALMTSSTQEVVKENGTTPADPFDMGAGSIRANRAVEPTVTFDETYERFVASAGDPLGRIHLNIASVNAPTMSGLIWTTRTVTNVTDRTQRLDIETSSPEGTRIDVSPRRLNLRPGESESFRIVISAIDAPEGWYFGQITLEADRRGYNDAVVPVAFNKRQGAVTLSHECVPTEFVEGESAECVAQAQNFASAPADVKLLLDADRGLEYRNVTGATSASRRSIFWQGTLSPALAPTIDAITEITGTPGYGYFDLAPFLPPEAGYGDETIGNYSVPAFRFGTEVYDTIGVTSNGYVVLGGGDADDVQFEPQTLPDTARPNNVLAPFWTDLNLAKGGGIRVAVFTCGGIPCYVVVDWKNVPTWSSSADANPANDEKHSFQIWIQTAAFAGEEQTFEYGAVTGPGDPVGTTAGAENRDGSSGRQITPLPLTGDTWTVEAGTPTPGGMVSIGYEAFARNRGEFDTIALLTSNVTPGVTAENVTLTVAKKPKTKGRHGGDD